MRKNNEFNIFKSEDNPRKNKSVKEKNSAKLLKKIKKKQIKRNTPPVSGIFSFVVNF